MSTSSIDMESEQSDRPTHGSAMGRRVSDNRVPQNTEEDEVIFLFFYLSKSTTLSTFNFIRIV